MTDNEPKMDEMQRISAFADGELEGEEQLRMLEKSQCCQVTAAKIKHQQQLRRACERVLKAECACPCAIKDKIKALCDADSSDRTSVIARIGRWAPALVAAVLLLGAVLIYSDALRSTNPSIDNIIPVAQAEQFNSRHVTCSRAIETLHNLDKFPDQLTALPQTVAEHLGAPVPALDLTALGYHFEGAGDCMIPGSNSVQIVYRAEPDSGHSDSVSLWMRADDGKLPIKDGTIYTRQCPDTNRKLLVWKRAGVVYYLLGDEPDRTEAIANSLRNVS